jgi:hypothetical protein
LFKKRIRLPEPPALSIDLLNEAFTGVVCDPLRFKQLSPHQIAFREGFLSFRLMNYTPVMHGLIRYDERMKELQVIGFANWFAPLFIVLFVLLGFSPPSHPTGGEVVFILFPLVLLVVLYLIQFRRFNSVYKALLSPDAFQPTVPPAEGSAHEREHGRIGASTGVKIIMGSAAALLSILAILTFFDLGPGRTGDLAQQFAWESRFGIVFVFIYFFVLVLYQLYNLKTGAVPRRHRDVWGLLLLIGFIPAMWVFYYLYVWRPPKTALPAETTRT